MKQRKGSSTRALLITFFLPRLLRQLGTYKYYLFIYFFQGLEVSPSPSVKEIESVSFPFLFSPFCVCVPVPLPHLSFLPRVSGPRWFNTTVGFLTPLPTSPSLPHPFTGFSFPRSPAIHCTQLLAAAPDSSIRLPQIISPSARPLPFLSLSPSLSLYLAACVNGIISFVSPFKQI